MNSNLLDMRNLQEQAKKHSVTKNLLTFHCLNELFQLSQKFCKFEAEGREFEITRIILVTRTIYSNSERLEQFLKRNPF